MATKVGELSPVESDAGAGNSSVAKIVFSNPDQREAHVAVFMAWLPDELRLAPGIEWERLPSRVMCYLLRTTSTTPDPLPIAL